MLTWHLNGWANRGASLAQTFQHERVAGRPVMAPVEANRADVIAIYSRSRSAAHSSGVLQPIKLASHAPGASTTPASA